MQFPETPESNPWCRHHTIPHLWLRRGGKPETFDCFSTEDGTFVIDLDAEALAHWAADRSRIAGKLPIGDWISVMAKALGFKQCVPCAMRRVKWNNLL